MSELDRRVIDGQSDQGRQPRKVGFTGRARFQEVEMQGWAGTKGYSTNKQSSELRLRCQPSF